MRPIEHGALFRRRDRDGTSATALRPRIFEDDVIALVRVVALPDGGEKREFNLDRFSTALVESVEVSRGRRAEMEADGIAGRVIVKQRAIPTVAASELSAGAGEAEDGGSQQWYSFATGGPINDHFGAQGAVAWSRAPAIKDKDKFDAAGTLSEREDETKIVTSADLLGDVLLHSAAGDFRFKPTFLEQEEDRTKTKDKFRNAAYDGGEQEDEFKTKQTAGGSLSWRREAASGSGRAVEARVSYFEGTEDKEKTKRTLKRDGSEDLPKFETEWEDKRDAVLQGDASLAIPLVMAGLEHGVKVGVLLREKDRRKTKTKERAGIAQAPGVKDIYTIDETVYAAFVQDRVALSDSITMIPGVRVEGVELSATSAARPVGDGDSVDILPSLPFDVRFGERWSLNAGVARVVNRPKFDLLIPFEEEKSDRVVTGNPDLRAEQAWAFDADLLYRTSSMHLGLGLFHREISDRIEEVFTGQSAASGRPLFQPDNVGDGWTHGVILSQQISLDSLSVPVVRGFSVYAHQTFARSELTDLATGERRPFKEQPKFFGDVVLGWSDPGGRVSVSTGLNYTGKVVSSGDAGDEFRKAEWSVDAQVHLALSSHLELFALGQSLGGAQRVKIKADGSREEESGARAFFVGVKAKY